MNMDWMERIAGIGINGVFFLGFCNNGISGNSQEGVGQAGQN